MATNNTEINPQNSKRSYMNYSDYLHKLNKTRIKNQSNKLSFGLQKRIIFFQCFISKRRSPTCRSWSTQILPGRSSNHWRLLFSFWGAEGFPWKNISPSPLVLYISNHISLLSHSLTSFIVHCKHPGVYTLFTHRQNPKHLQYPLQKGGQKQGAQGTLEKKHLKGF